MCIRDRLCTDNSITCWKIDSYVVTLVMKRLENPTKNSEGSQRLATEGGHSELRVHSRSRYIRAHSTASLKAPAPRQGCFSVKSNHGGWRHLLGAGSSWAGEPRSEATQETKREVRNTITSLALPNFCQRVLLNQEHEKPEKRGFWKKLLLWKENRVREGQGIHWRV